MSPIITHNSCPLARLVIFSFQFLARWCDSKWPVQSCKTILEIVPDCRPRSYEKWPRLITFPASVITYFNVGVDYPFPWADNFSIFILNIVAIFCSIQNVKIYVFMMYSCPCGTCGWTCAGLELIRCDTVVLGQYIAIGHWLMGWDDKCW